MPANKRSAPIAPPIAQLSHPPRIQASDHPLSAALMLNRPLGVPQQGARIRRSCVSGLSPEQPSDDGAPEGLTLPSQSKKLSAHSAKDVRERRTPGR